MNQESNFLNQWFHLRYQEDLSEFDDGLSLSNLYTLVGAGRLLGSVLLLAAVMLHRHCGVAWLHLLPSFLVGAGMIVLVERLWRGQKTAAAGRSASGIGPMDLAVFTCDVCDGVLL